MTEVVRLLLVPGEGLPRAVLEPGAMLKLHCLMAFS